jgi:hypothetical protein
MEQETSDVISIIFKAFSSKRGKVIIICLGAASLIVILSELFVKPGRPSSLQKSTLSVLSETDEAGNTWTLDLIKGQPLSRIHNSDKKPGPPLIIRTNIRKINNSQLSIGITVEGQAGEKYIGGVIKNGMLEPEPQFIIVDEKGRILGGGIFEYGRGSMCRYSWRIPRRFWGKFQVKVAINLGPFEAEHEEIWHSVN